MTPSGSHLTRNILIFAVLAIILIGAGYFYVKHQELYPDTEDAYVHAKILYVAPQISGKLVNVNVSNYQHVNAGDVLVQIDPAPYQTQYQQAKAIYEAATQNNKATDDAILAASANVQSASAQLIDVQQTYHRIMDLVQKKLLPTQQGDDVKAKLAQAENAVAAARAKMSQLITAQGAKGDQAPQVKQAAAALSRATLDLSYTNVVAAHDGTLGKVSVHAGSVVAAGQAMMPLIEDNTFWVSANYKETDVGRLKVGMSASIELDMYPDINFSGKVTAISPASGSSFSLLPQENATGNWVKVPQRFPVKIAIYPSAKQPPLRVGATASVTVNTQSIDTQHTSVANH